MTTGSLALGLVRGMKQEMGASGAGIPALLYVEGTPDGNLMAVTGNDVVYDAVNDQFYKSETASETDWIKLGSVA